MKLSQEIEKIRPDLVFMSVDGHYYLGRDISPDNQPAGTKLFEGAAGSIDDWFVAFIKNELTRFETSVANSTVQFFDDAVQRKVDEQLQRLKIAEDEQDRRILYMVFKEIRL